MKGITQWICCLLVALLVTFTANAQSGRQAIYAALASGSSSALNRQLTVVQSLNAPDKEALEGALLMRKSASQKVPSQKLSMFRKGHRLLEAAIGKAPANLEYLFLRLMIQEHAPKVVGYHKNLAADAQLIKKGYPSLPAVVQKAVLNYSKTSKALSGLQ